MRAALPALVLAAVALGGCKRTSGGSSKDTVLATAGSGFSDHAVGVIAVDGPHVYYVDGYRSDARLMRVPKLGGEAAVQIAKVRENVSAIAIDATHAFLATEGGVVRVPKAIGRPETIAPETNCTRRCGIALDDTHVYYTTKSAVMRVAKSGGAPSVVTPDPDSPSCVVVDASNVYFYDSNVKDIMSAPKAGGPAQKVAEDDDTSDGDSLILSDGSLFWLHAQKVRSVALTGGAVRTVATTGPHYQGLAVDGKYVYFTRKLVQDSLQMTLNKGGLARAPRGGGPAEDVFRGDADLKAVVVDDAALYWIGVGTVVRTPKP